LKTPKSGLLWAPAALTQLKIPAIANRAVVAQRRRILCCLKQPQLIALSLALLLGLAAVAPLAHAQTYSIFYTFPSNQDGNRAQGVIEDGAGNLYGAAYYGGAHSEARSLRSILRARKPCSTALRARPTEMGRSALVRDAHGNLYGATYLAVLNCLFSRAPAAGRCSRWMPVEKETVLHAFGGRGDGVAPVGVVMDSKGSLYGTTSNGGDFSCDGKYTRAAARSSSWMRRADIPSCTSSREEWTGQVRVR